MLRIVAPRSPILGYRPGPSAWRLSRSDGGWARLAAAGRMVWLWMERSRQRRALAALNDHLLRDIGLTRDAVRRECAQPFWMP
jgi:uncharacterized protein YjiS (DUF1127 family)